MSAEKIESILGIPLHKLDGITAFSVYCDLGDGVECLGKARSVEGALLLIHAQAFAAEKRPRVENDAAFDELVDALSDDNLMERTTTPRDLVYLAEVLEKQPGLRLIVAWEAAPPLQDAAFGIFAPKPN